MKTLTIEQERVIEGNKLIAEFMGAIIVSEYLNENKEIEHVLYDFVNKDKYPDNSRYHSSNCLYYHKDWSWLMPVLEKIGGLDNYCLKTTQSLTISQRWYMYSISIYENTLKGMDEPILKIDSDYTNGETKISTYWRFMVEFIKLKYHE